MMLEKRETPLSLYIKELVDRSPLTDHEIGVLCGFKSGSLIRAFAEGEIRPPIDRLDKLAEATNGDLGMLLTLAIKELFSPRLLEQLQQIDFWQTDPAKKSWLSALDEIFDGRIPEMDDSLRRRLEHVITAS